jgi:acetylornithine deacetylase/succinyl-diaminopimelate desuccinylase-like protein
MCVIGEPTGMRLVRTHLGSVWAQIEVEGELVHTAFARDDANAIVRMTRVIEAIRAWIPDYQRRHTVDGLAPKVNIGAIEGGWPWRASRTPARCRLFLDVRTPPELDLRRVREELRDVLDAFAQREGFRARVDLYATHPGTSIPADAPVVQEVTAAHREIVGADPVVETANWYSDAATLNRYGVPAINYGPGGRLRTGGVGWSQAEGEHQHVGDLVECTKVYVNLILRVCGVTA